MKRTGVSGRRAADVNRPRGWGQPQVGSDRLSFFNQKGAGQSRRPRSIALTERSVSGIDLGLQRCGVCRFVLLLRSRHGGRQSVFVVQALLRGSSCRGGSRVARTIVDRRRGARRVKGRVISAVRTTGRPVRSRLPHCTLHDAGILRRHHTEHRSDQLSDVDARSGTKISADWIRISSHDSRAFAADS
jgi:hypothetical protein